MPEAVVPLFLVLIVALGVTFRVTTAEERDRCSPFLREEIALMKNLRSVIVLGGFGWKAFLPLLGPERPKFGHGVEVEMGGLRVFGCYHVSPHNTYTGKLTQEMLQAVLRRASQPEV